MVRAYAYKALGRWFDSPRRHCFCKFLSVSFGKDTIKIDTACKICSVKFNRIKICGLETVNQCLRISVDSELKDLLLRIRNIIPCVNIIAVLGRMDPTGRFLFVGNQKSNKLVVFTVDDHTGKLTPAGQTIETPSPADVLFIPAG